MNKEQPNNDKKQDEKNKYKEYLDKGDIPDFGKKRLELKLNMLIIVALGTLLALIIIWLFW